MDMIEGDSGCVALTMLERLATHAHYIDSGFRSFVQGKGTYPRTKLVYKSTMATLLTK